MKAVYLFCLLCLFVAAVYAGTPNNNGTVSNSTDGTVDATTVAGMLQASSDHSTFFKLLQDAKIAPHLGNMKTRSTVFAPSNDAFSDDVLDKLSKPQNVGILRNILAYHIVRGGPVIKPNRLDNGRSFKTLQGQKITINPIMPIQSPSSKQVDNSTSTRIVDANGNAVSVNVQPMVAKNGLIYSIDGIMRPANIVGVLKSNPDYSKCVEMIESAGLTSKLETLPLLTVFAPNNDAFEKLSPAGNSSTSATDTLLMHVSREYLRARKLVTRLKESEDRMIMLNTLGGKMIKATLKGSKVYLGDGDARVVMADAYAVNGIVHGINEVIMMETQPAANSTRKH